MSEDEVELFIDHVIAVTTGRTAYAVRCHAGTLRRGDELRIAIDPEGAQHVISARCSHIELAPSIPVEELDTNFGGQVILDGVDLDSIQEGWTVRSEG